MDLRQWPRQWRGAADLLLDAPGLRALTPPVPVRLLRADGRITNWWWRHGAAWPAADKQLPANAALALELPADAVLERSLTLPLLNQTDVAEAVALEAASISPFGAAQTVWGFAVLPPAKGASTQTVRMALTSRKQIEHSLAQAQAVFAADGQTRDQASGEPESIIEIWVLPQVRSSHDGDGVILVNGAQERMRPIAFKTGGEAPRQALVARGRAGRVALVGLAGVLLAAILATPVLQARSRAMQAQAGLDRVSSEVAPQMAQREALIRQAEALRGVGDVLKTQLAPLPVLDLVTRALPDSAWLNTLRLEGDKVTITGNADDAAALVQALSRQEGVRDVRLPSPATRSSGASKESFTIEIRLDPNHYGLAKTQEGA
jgi:general secretion pathway protein L